MRKYEKYKTSNFEWFGTVPANWKEGKVNYYFEIGRGRVISELELNPDGIYPVFSSQTKNGGCLGYIDTYDFDGEMLTWTTDGANAGTVFIRDGKFNCTNVCGTLIPRENLYLKYFLFYLQNITPFYKRPDTNGAKIMNGEMARIYCLIPSLKEQTQIARYLEHQTSLIDALIEKKEKLVELLKEKRQAIINEAVTKGLNPDAKMKDSGIEWLGKVPEDWLLTKMKFACQFIFDGTHGSFSRVDDGYRLLSVRNIIHSKFTFRDDDSRISEKDYLEICSKFEILEDDIQLAIVGATLGKVALVEKMSELFVTQRSLATIRADSKKCLPKYLFYFLRSSSFQSYLWLSTSFSAQPGVYLGTIQKCALPLPNIKEQEKIVSFLELDLSSIEEVSNRIIIQICKLNEYRQSIISEAVTGKVDLRDWQPKKNKMETVN
jgi:type I restriction enzyme S subunit